MRRVVIRALALTAVVPAVVGCAVGAGVLLVASQTATPAVVQAPAGDAPAHPPATATGAERRAARVSALLVEHRCWTDGAPAGAPAPGHAVVTRPGGSPRLVAEEVGFGIWLEGEPGVLHGFCP